MISRDKVVAALACICVTLLALVITAWYTSSNLEMAWLFVWVAIPITGFIVGGLLALLLKVIFKTTMAAVLGVIMFSVVIFSALMLEETAIGLIRRGFDDYTNKLNQAELARPLHEIPLGDGGFLYFKENKDDSFSLNFDYQGDRVIGREQIVELGTKWLKAEGYKPIGNAELIVYPVIYRKEMSFNLKANNDLQAAFNIEQDPRHPEQGNITIYLALRHKEGRLFFEETARGYQPRY